MMIKKTDYSDSSEGDTDVKEIDLKLTSETVDTIIKKLKAKWTIELEQDLQAYHGLSVETELMSILQTQIIREIDGMIISALLLGASGTGTGVGTGAGNVNWNANGYLEADTTTTYRRDYRKTLYEAIEDAANLIYKKRYQYPTWIIGHPDAIVRLEKLEEFKIHLPQKLTRGLLGAFLLVQLIPDMMCTKTRSSPQPISFCLDIRVLNGAMLLVSTLLMCLCIQLLRLLTLTILFLVVA